MTTLGVRIGEETRSAARGKGKGKKLRVGVIGAGGMGRTHMASWMELAKEGEVEIVAVCDLVKAKADERAAEFNLPRAVYRDEDLFALKPDVVDIIVPNRSHCEVTVASLKAGCHTICEKPLAATAAEVRRMIAASAKSRRLLMAAQNQRFTPQAQALKRHIEAGALGEVYYVHGQWVRRRGVPARENYYRKEFSAGGPIIDLGVHILDVSMWLTGNFKPVSVTGIAPCRMAKRRDVLGLWGKWDVKKFNVEDFGAAFIRFASGAVMAIEVSWLSNIVEAEINRATILGTHGGATYPQAQLSTEAHGSLVDSTLTHLPRDKSYVTELRAFCEAVRRGGPSPVPPAESLQVARVLEAWYRSSRTGKEVKLAAK